MSPPRKKLKDKQNVGLDEGSESDEDGNSPSRKGTESNYEAIPPFKDLYPHSDIVRCLMDFGPNIIPL